MAKIYLADDEKNIRDIIGVFLRDQGLDVELFETGDQLLLRFMNQPADVVILDVMMPGSSGFEVAPKLRQLSNVTILFLTAKDSDKDFIEGFQTGADDYLTKPFSPMKLALRIKAIIARQDHQIDTNTLHLKFENLTLSPENRCAIYANQQINLTNTEFDVLELLLKKQEQAVSREDLLESVWGYNFDVDMRVTDDTIKRLRKKLRQVNSNVIIETVWGFGFKLAQTSEK
ncbi:response regulator transcription factor [Streptococcus hongkongensis]|nr:regulator [Streptococcus uberis]